MAHGACRWCPRWAASSRSSGTAATEGCGESTGELVEISRELIADPQALGSLREAAVRDAPGFSRERFTDRVRELLLTPP